MAFESVRERLAVRLGELLGELFGAAGVDVPAVVALLASAVNYLSVRRRHIQTFNEVSIGTDEGWQRIAGREHTGLLGVGIYG